MINSRDVIGTHPRCCDRDGVSLLSILVDKAINWEWELGCLEDEERRALCDRQNEATTHICANSQFLE